MAQQLRTYCICRPAFDSHHPCGGSQPPIYLVPRDPTASLASMGARHAHGTQTLMQTNTCTHKIQIKLSKSSQNTEGKTTEEKQKKSITKNSTKAVRKMVQWLRACCVLAEDPSLVLSTLISAPSCLQLQLQKVPTFLTHAGTYTHLYTPSHIHTYTYRHD